jgi:hypothetical protein
MHHIMTTMNIEKKRTARERLMLIATTICLSSASGASTAGADTISLTKSQEGISSYRICVCVYLGGSSQECELRGCACVAAAARCAKPPNAPGPSAARTARPSSR